MKSSKEALRPLVALALAGAALTAGAEFICWQVADAKMVDESTTEGGGVELPFSYATIKADGTLLNIYTANGMSDYTRLYADVADESDPTAMGRSTYGYGVSGSFDSSVASCFLVELWDYDDKLIGWKRYGIGDLTEYIWPTYERPEGSSGTPLTVTAVVPEPTGGLLALFGLAALALRRRRA